MLLVESYPLLFGWSRKAYLRYAARTPPALLAPARFRSMAFQFGASRLLMDATTLFFFTAAAARRRGAVTISRLGHFAAQEVALEKMWYDGGFDNVHGTVIMTKCL